MINYKPYLSLARIDNWSKNLLMLAGAGLAYMISDPGTVIDWLIVLKVMASLCLASSSNYVLNEVIDASFDRYHPLKKSRSAVRNQLNIKIIAVEYACLALVALALAYSAHSNLASVISIYIAAAWFYNIPPVRIKDVAYADVLLESFNYPLRILTGWMCVFPTQFPPSTIFIISWTIGGFTMSVKRLAEYQLFKNSDEAGNYRKSYKVYTLEKLIISSFIYGVLAIFGITVFLLKYKIEFILLLPLITLWFACYLSLGLGRNETTIYPERLFSNRLLTVFSVSILLVAIALANADLPWIHILQEPLHFSASSAS